MKIQANDVDIFILSFQILLIEVIFFTCSFICGALEVN